MKNIVYIGDLHGNFDFIRWWLKQGDHKNVTIIQVGDFGIGFKPTIEDNVLQLLNKELGTRESILLVIRGNHDNPSYFDGNHDYEFIKFLPDYTTMEIDGLNHLFIGGALSIDRKVRTTGIDYWEDEGFMKNLDKISDIKNIDVVVTHTAPNFVEPFGFNGIVAHYALNDGTLLEELTRERDAITEVFDLLQKNNNIQYHFYGHFHYDTKNLVNGCTHVMLNISQVYNPYLYI
jgi:hypothetical protein